MSFCSPWLGQCVSLSGELPRFSWCLFFLIKLWRKECFWVRVATIPPPARCNRWEPKQPDTHTLHQPQRHPKPRKLACRYPASSQLRTSCLVASGVTTDQLQARGSTGPESLVVSGQDSYSKLPNTQTLTSLINTLTPLLLLHTIHHHTQTLRVSFYPVLRCSLAARLPRGCPTPSAWPCLLITVALRYCKNAGRNWTHHMCLLLPTLTTSHVAHLGVLPRLSLFPPMYHL